MDDIGLSELKVLSKKIQENNDCIYTVAPTIAPEKCPECGSVHFIKHRKYERKVRDLNECGHRVGIVIEGHRYQCKDCGNTFGEQFRSIASGQLTNRLKARIQADCFEKTFKEISDEYGISQPSVKRVFEEYIDELNKNYKPYAPKVLGINEVHLHSQYRGVFVDITGQKVIEMTETRSKETIKKFLMSLPDRENITCITMDMWKLYRDVVRNILPNIPVVIDKFHVIKMLNKTLEDILNALKKSIDKDKGILLKNMWFLFLTGNEKLSSRQSAQLQFVLDACPQFYTPYQLKEAFRNIYLYSETREEAELVYSEWLTACKDSNCPAYDNFIATVANWHTEIFNYFDHRYINAQTENLSNIIREIDRAGRGYTFEILRAKMLFRGSIGKKGQV